MREPSAASPSSSYAASGAVDRVWIVIQILFVASGAAALAYEVVWGRWLATVLGASTLATSIVLACYMGGLAAGAYAFGRYSARTEAPLRIYALVEALIAVVAVLFPQIAAVTIGLPPALRLVVAIVVLLMPTFLMGGTLPLVVAWSEQRRPAPCARCAPPVR